MLSGLTFVALWFAAPQPGRHWTPARCVVREWQLAKDRAEVDGFPSDAEAERNWQLGLEHVKWLDGRLIYAYAAEPHAAPRWAAWRKDAGWCLWAWSLLGQCRNPHNSPCERANARSALECHLGYEDYAARRMPPPMPDWWFREE